MDCSLLNLPTGNGKPDKHCGCHPTYIVVLWDENREAMAGLFRSFLGHLRSQTVVCLSGDLPVLLAMHCSDGRWASVAMQCIFMQCCFLDGFQTDTELWFINDIHWRSDFCHSAHRLNDVSCEACHFKVPVDELKFRPGFWQDVMFLWGRCREEMIGS